MAHQYVRQLHNPVVRRRPRIYQPPEVLRPSDQTIHRRTQPHIQPTHPDAPIFDGTIINESGTLADHPRQRLNPVAIWVLQMEATASRAALTNRVTRQERPSATVADSSYSVYNYSYSPEEETMILSGESGGVVVVPGNKRLSEGLIGKLLRTRASCPEDKREAKICAVCLDGLRRDMKIGVLDNCRHEFHVGCISRWLRKNNVCPLCREVGLGR